MTQDGHFNLKELKNLKGTAKIRFIWDYYKIPIFLICVCVYVAGYIIWRNVTAEYPQLYLAYVNLEAGETLDRHLTEEFIDYLYKAIKHYKDYLKQQRDKKHEQGAR